MHQPSDRRVVMRWVRPMLLTLVVVAVVTFVGWKLDDPKSATLDSPALRDGSSELETFTSPTVPAAIAQDPAWPTPTAIRQAPSPGAIDIRNDVDGVDVIKIIGLSPAPITVGRSDKPGLRPVASGHFIVDVQDASDGHVLVSRAVLRLLPDEVTTLLVRRNADGEVVLAAAP